MLTVHLGEEVQLLFYKVVNSSYKLILYIRPIIV
jgi:hypothetical protein